MTERKMVTVEEVVDVQPVPNADALDLVTVRGWNVVVKRDEMALGDKVLYFELDSFLPISDKRFAFLAPRGTRKVLVEGEELSGHVLRTVRLRGQVSQGLVLPVEDFPEVAQCGIGEDVSSLIGVFKYEKPIPSSITGRTEGAFPLEFAPKTDAERVQNLARNFDMLKGHEWIASEKVDGSSTTIINDGGNIRICSRNWEQKVDEDLPAFIAAQRQGIIEAMEPGMVVQAEIAGPGIQQNRLGLTDITLFVFNVLKDYKYLPRAEWPDDLQKNAVPIYPLDFPESVSEAVAQVDGIKSRINPQRLAEGVVWHTVDGTTFQCLGMRDGFKAISNKFLLKSGE